MPRTTNPRPTPQRRRASLAFCALWYLALFAGLTSLAGMAGCELFNPTTTGPVSGKPVDMAGLIREMNQAEAQAKAEAQAAADAAAAKVAKAKADARRASIELTQRQNVTAAEIAAKAAQVEADTGQAIEEAQASMAAATKALHERMAVLAQQGDDAAAAIKAKADRNGAVAGFLANIPGVKTAASSAGVDLASLIALGSVGGNLWQNRSRRKAADAAYEEGHRDGHKAATEKHEAADKAWNEAQLALHQVYAPPPAARTMPVLGTLPPAPTGA